MKIVVDMNLSPRWAAFLGSNGIETTHWSEVGNPRATDSEIMEWARNRGYIVFTHDLDFSVLLSLTQNNGPSILQARTQDVTPEAIGSLVLATIRRHADALIRGAIVTIYPQISRVRFLPI